MPAFQNSPFLMALGWAIANSIWQSGLLWLFYQLTAGFNVKLSAKYKNAFSTSLVFMSFIWFVYTLIAKLISTKPSSDLAYSQTDLFNASSVASTYNFESLFSALKFSLPYLSVAYMILLGILFIKFFKAYNASVFIRKYGIVPATEQWLNFTAKAASKIRINRRVSIWFSTYINVPATVGFLKPVLLIPLASVNQLSTEQLEAIILHELAHIHRNDYLLNIIISVIETILFFNPFIVLLVKVVKRERENCCDDLVIHYKYDRHSYASALVSIEKTRLNRYPLAMSATSGKNQLLTRIKRIVENGKEINTFNYGQKLLTLLVITAIMISVSWIYPTHQTKKITKSNATIDDKIQPEKIKFTEAKDAGNALSINIETKKPIEKKSVTVSSLIEKAAKKSEKEIQDVISDKATLTLQKLKALINAGKSNVQKGDNFNLTFDMNEDFDKTENNFSWSYSLPDESFQYVSPTTDIDKAIDALLQQSKEINYENRALIDKQYFLNNLSEQYLEQTKKFKSAFDGKAVFEYFRKIKLHSLVFNGDGINSHLENPLLPFERKAFERTNKRIIERDSKMKTADIVTRENTNLSRLKSPPKKTQPNNVQTPLTIDFNGKNLSSG
jgi:beta-lactamase regulating signal transducer with metallopeptidase domain